MQRRANDAQIDRLLTALRRPDNKPGLSDYGKQLARKIATRDKIKLESAQRRLQRYITGAGERRSFVRAPVQYQREVRQIARGLPPPTLVPLPLRRTDPAPQFVPRFADESEHTDLYELRAIIAFFDGDTREAGKRLRVDSRILDLASQGTVITRRMGAGRIDEGVERLYEELSDDERQDVRLFEDFLRDFPEWEITVIMDALAEGEMLFSDWVDFLRERDDSVDWQDDSEFWALWRQAYKVAK